jgi:hypothetical protein
VKDHPNPGRGAAREPPPLPQTPFTPGGEASLVKKRGRRNNEFVNPKNFQDWLNFVAKKMREISLRGVLKGNKSGSFVY